MINLRRSQSSVLPIIDRHHDLGQNLVFFDYHGNDLVTGQIGSPVSSYSGSTSEKTDSWKGRALESHSTTNGGFVFPASREIARVYGGREITVLIDCEIDSMASYGHIIASPISASSWSLPWVGFSFLRVTTGTVARLVWRTGFSTSTSVDSGTNYLIIDGTRHTYSVTLNQGNVRFYRDGVYHSGGSGTNADIYQSLNSVYLFSRNTTASAEGSNGRIYSAGIWKRTLTDAEIESLYVRPYQMLRARLMPSVMIPASAPSTWQPAWARRTSYVTGSGVR